MTAHKDVVLDFLEHAGISTEGLQTLKDNVSPSNEELLMRIVYNSMFERAVPIREFDEEIGGLIKYDIPPSEYFARYMPRDKDLFELCQDTLDDKKKLNRILKMDFEEEIGTFSNRKNYDINDSKLISMLLQIVLSLQKQLKDVRNELKELKKE
jgi:hypothetical protein